MSVESRPSAQGIPVTVDDVRRWWAQHGRLAQQIADLEKQQAALNKMIEGAAAFLTPEQMAEFRPQESVSKSGAGRRRTRKPESWASTILRLLSDAGGVAPFFELKEAVKGTHLAGKLAASEKSFYGALDRLSNRGEIVRHKGRAFFPKAFDQFRKDVAAGKAKDMEVVAPNRRRSPMGDAVYRFVEANPTRFFESRALVSALRIDPKIAAEVEKNPTQVYNILSRMVRRGDLVKRGRRYRAAPGRFDNENGDPEPTLTLNGSGGNSGDEDDLTHKALSA